MNIHTLIDLQKQYHPEAFYLRASYYRTLVEQVQDRYGKDIPHNIDNAIRKQKIGSTHLWLIEDHRHPDVRMMVGDEHDSLHV